MTDNSWCEKQDRTNHDDQIIVVNIVNHFIVFFLQILPVQAAAFVHKNQNYYSGIQLQNLKMKTTEMFASVEIWATMAPPRLQDHQRTKIAESETSAGISPRNVTWCNVKVSVSKSDLAILAD